MKKFSTIILSLLFAAVFTLPVFASAATSPGIKPGNLFYFFDTSFEKIGLFFTFSPEKKARRALQYADERLAEIEGIAEEKDTDAVKTAISNYENNVALAAEKSKEVTDKAKAENLLTVIEDNAAKNQDVLSVVLTKVPEEAREAILRAISASRKGQEEAAKQIIALKGEVEKLKQEVEELKKEASDPQADEVEKLKKEVEALKEKQKTVQPVLKQSVPATQQPQETKKPEEKFKTVTLPSGAVVETDANGNIVRYIQQPSVDFCSNIEGTQSYIPNGMTKNNAGDCITLSAPTNISAPVFTTTQIPSAIIQQNTTSIPAFVPAELPSGSITVSIAPHTPNGGNLIKGSKGVALLTLNFESTWNSSVQINRFGLKLIGGSKNDFGSFKINNSMATPSFFGNEIILDFNGTYLNKGQNSILIQADIPLTAKTGDVFHLEFSSASGVNTTSGQGYQASGVAIGNTFTIYQPPIDDNSPTVSLAPNTVFGLTDNQCESGCSYIATRLHFDAKNNPFSILKLALTFDGVIESDIKNVKLSWGGIYNKYKLYPVSTYSANGQKVAYINENKIIFQNFSPYELTHVNPNETSDLTVEFETNPSGIGKTIRIDLVNPFTDIIASNYETGLVLPVGGSAIGSTILINKQ